MTQQEPEVTEENFEQFLPSDQPSEDGEWTPQEAKPTDEDLSDEEVLEIVDPPEDTTATDTEDDQDPDVDDLPEDATE